MARDKLMCSECDEKPGAIFLCGEGYMCEECYDARIAERES